MRAFSNSSHIKKIEKWIAKWYYIHHLIYILLKLLNKITLFKATKKESAEGKTIIVYSKKTYNPYIPLALQPLSETGGAVLIRNIINLFGEKNILYFDSNENIRLDMIKDPIKRIIGIHSKNTLNFFKKFNKSEKIFLAVNTYAPFRNHILAKEASINSFGIPIDELSNPILEVRIMFHADRVLLLGSRYVAKSFETLWPKRSVTIFNNYVNKNIYNYDGDALKEKSIIYPTSLFGLRKGAFRLKALMPYLSNLFNEGYFENLYITGNADLVFSQMLLDMHKKYPFIKYLGWLDTLKQAEYYKKVKIVLSLSLEEGQVSTVLEAMYCGCAPLISEASGVDLNKYGLLKNISDNESPAEIAHKLKLILNQKDKKIISNNKHYLTYHHETSGIDKIFFV